jgi:hypothetical protein
MPLQTQSYSTLVQNQVAAIQASSSALLDFEIGSILLALVESNTANVGLFIQGLLLALLATTRLSTSQGNDVDTFIADYGLKRLAAVAATGTVTFARFTSTQQGIVLANETPSLSTQVQTADGLQIFYVTIDTSNPNYSAPLGGYVLLANTASIDVPVEASVAGAAGNVAVGALNTIVGTIPFVDTVTNASSFTNGVDKESDAAVKIRFVAYIGSLSKATKTAIGFAITSVQQGLIYTLTENEDYNGDTDYGYFYVVVDDGTGTPSGDLLSTVSNAIDAVRGCAIRFGVFAPIVTTANVSMTVTVTSGYVQGTVAGIVEDALTDYINALPLGTTLAYTRLMQVAYDASPGVLDVTSVLLNSGTSDVTANAQHVIKAGTITVN